MIVLIGTYAAQLLQCLPYDREAKDVDLYGSSQDHEMMVHLLGCASIPTGDYHYVMRYGGKTIEFTTKPYRSMDIIRSLSDNKIMQVFGISVLVPSATTLYVLKRSSRGLLNGEKNQKDLKWLKPHISITKDHLILFKQARLEALERYNSRQIAA